MTPRPPSRTDTLTPWLPAYALVTWGGLVAHALVFPLDAHVSGVSSVAYVVALHAVYSILLTVAGLAPAAMLAAALVWRRRRTGATIGRVAGISLGVAAVVGPALLHIAIFADAFVRERWGFHLNGMIWDLLTTPGGVESLGAGASTDVTAAAIVAGFVALQAAVLVVVRRSRAVASLGTRAVPGRRLVRVGWGTLGTAAIVLLASGLAEAASYRPVTTVGEAYPLYPRFRLGSLARALGIGTETAADGSIAGADGAGGADSTLAYPLVPLRRGADAPTPNIVWLVAESLRADMLEPEIMPNTVAFAADGGRRFDRHFSAGNGTEMGVFGLFYGLTGPYWDLVLAASRGPSLIATLSAAGYDVEAYTSARFTYPQFDRTVWAQVPPVRLHERDPDIPGWRNDRKNVAKLLKSLDDLPDGTPFFRFMFFESPHAPYLFPADDALREDYVHDINYMSMDLSDQAEVGRIFNRYVNACHHLDEQLGIVYEGLRERGLLDSTIVLVAGDHGEEFMEHGHWGHHSAVTDAQTRTTFVLRGPGIPAGVETALTSHLDTAPTFLRLLGVENPPSDFSLGLDLIEGPRRDHTIVSAFADLAVIDDHYKLVYAFQGGGELRERATTADDRPAADDPAVAPLRLAQIPTLLAESRRFVR